jgi:hypothetical protein
MRSAVAEQKLELQTKEQVGFSEQTAGIRTHDELYTDNPRNSSSPWTFDEDQILLNASHKDWSLVARSLPGRTSKQCWHRYHNFLKHQFRTGDWTPQEDYLILKQQAVIGNRWSQIALLLPGRSENSVKNRWHSSLRPRLERNEISVESNFTDKRNQDRQWEMDMHGIAERTSESDKVQPLANFRSEFGKPSAHFSLVPCTPPKRVLIPAHRSVEVNAYSWPLWQQDAGAEATSTASGARGKASSGRLRASLMDTPGSPGRHTRHRLLLCQLLRRSAWLETGPSACPLPRKAAGPPPPAAAAGAGGASSSRGHGDSEPQEPACHADHDDGATPCPWFHEDAGDGTSSGHSSSWGYGSESPAGDCQSQRQWWEGLEALDPLPPLGREGAG